jgi:hypothetical protein
MCDESRDIQYFRFLEITVIFQTLFPGIPASRKFCTIAERTETVIVCS